MGKDKETTYNSIIKEKINRAFFERLISSIENNVSKYFGKEEAKKVINTLYEGKIKIENPENFLFSEENLRDSSLEFLTETSSFDEFFYNSILKFKERAELGESEIEVREFLIGLVHLTTQNPNKINKEFLNKYMKIMLTTLSNRTHSSPFTLTVPNKFLMGKISNLLGLNTSRYHIFLLELFKCYNKIYEQDELYPPAMNLVCPIYEDTRFNQEARISKFFGIRKTRINGLINKIPSLSEDTPELRKILNKLKKDKGYTYFNIDGLILELNRIGNERALLNYPTMRNIGSGFTGAHSPEFAKVCKVPFLSKVFTYQELYEKTIKPYICNISINCLGASETQIEYLIGIAKIISLTKIYYLKEQNNKIIEDPVIKITLEEVENTTLEFVSFIKNKAKKLISETNKEFLIIINYSKKVATAPFKEAETSYFRVIGDIHADYNREHSYIFNFGNDFVLNCGDTGGNASSCIQWCKNYMTQGVTIAGNHLGYSMDFPKLGRKHVDNTKNVQLVRIGKSFTGANGLRLLSNSEITYKGIKILGTTLFTDFALYGEEHIEECMQYAKKAMNDFQLVTSKGHRSYEESEDGIKAVYLKKEEWNVRDFTPQDHAYFFKHSMKYLKEKVEEYSDKPIIIVTHHAPSPYSISLQYTGSMLNPAFASNLNQFIVEHPQIRLWCHGHVHTPFDYILGETRVVCCPFGYNNENNADLPYNYGKRIATENVKSKESWRKICKDEIEQGIIKVYEN